MVDPVQMCRRIWHRRACKFQLGRHIWQALHDTHPVVSPAAASLSAEFARHLAARRAPARRGWVGVEQEYRLSRAGAQVDFRSLIEGLGAGPARLDPGDAVARRLRSGAALTCDGMDAEIALPPVPIGPGFSARIDGRAQAELRRLLPGLPEGTVVEGYSTHFNCSIGSRLCEPAAVIYTRTFAPALMLLMDRITSPGLLVRPRPARLELCGEYVERNRLRMVAVFAAGSTLACAKAAETPDARLPPRLRVAVEPAGERYGWFVDRLAFGSDLYRGGRNTALPLAGGGVITAQDHLEQAWQAAKDGLGAALEDPAVSLLDEVVGGGLPLPCEAELAEPGLALTLRLPATIHGRMLACRCRPGFTVHPAMVTWGHALFRLRSVEGREAIVSVPADLGARFLDQLDQGRLDQMLTAYLALPPAGRHLARPEQTATAAIFDSVGQRHRLLPAEKTPIGVLRPPENPAAAALPAAGQLPNWPWLLAAGAAAGAVLLFSAGAALGLPAGPLAGLVGAASGLVGTAGAVWLHRRLPAG